MYLKLFCLTVCVYRLISKKTGLILTRFSPAADLKKESKFISTPIKTRATPSLQQIDIYLQTFDEHSKVQSKYLRTFIEHSKVLSKCLRRLSNIVRYCLNICDPLSNIVKYCLNSTRHVHTVKATKRVRSFNVFTQYCTCL